jgi:L-serine dehydratase
MKSIRDIYVIGNGPSSSHTMGPSFAVDYILNKYKNIHFVKVYLYESLALTGKGHLTDYIISKKLNDNNIENEIVFDFKTSVDHPNTMKFEIILNDDSKFEEVVVSSGGGTIITSSPDKVLEKELYKEKNLTEILRFCSENDISLYQYIINHEGLSFIDYLKTVLKTMDNAIERGKKTDGLLPGSLKVKRKAKDMFEKTQLVSDDFNKMELLVSVSSFAVSEENASGGVVVTAPTCGSCGVIPGVITYLRLKGYSDDKILEGLAVAGIIGKVIKENASVSGAVGGCQAEIGAASSMGAALMMHVYDASNEKIAQAAEMALEHSLGLTCDPIRGYVQIPCIERNSIFALKAINAAHISLIIDKETSLISFDDIVDTMYRTGKDLHTGYKETSTKGMSEIKKFN